jgi:hypothetical protein
MGRDGTGGEARRGEARRGEGLEHHHKIMAGDVVGGPGVGGDVVHYKQAILVAKDIIQQLHIHPGGAIHGFWMLWNMDAAFEEFVRDELRRRLDPSGADFRSHAYL